MCFLRRAHPSSSSGTAMALTPCPELQVSVRSVIRLRHQVTRLGAVLALSPSLC
jgi:hypothetical protein